MLIRLDRPILRKKLSLLWGMEPERGEVRPFLGLKPEGSADFVQPKLNRKYFGVWVSGILLGGKGRPARKADNLTAISEPII
jgi:hypothetical protein